MYDKHEIAYLRRVIGFLLIAGFVLWAVYPKEVRAAEVLKNVDRQDRPMSLTLTQKPCKDSVKQWFTKVNPALHDLMKAAILFYAGKNWDSCWVDIDGFVYSIDEEGVPFQGGQGIPRRLFRENTI